MKKQRWAIIGGGVSGCFLSHLLKSDPHAEVTIFEKSRGIGGRCSVRRHSIFGAFNHGAQFFTNKNPELSQYYSQLKEQGLIEPFHTPIGYSSDKARFSAATAEERFVGNPFMNSFLKKWSEDAIVRTELKIRAIERVNNKWKVTDDSGEGFAGFDRCVLTVPYPQGIDFWTMHSSIQISKPELFPCWSVMLISSPIQSDFSAAFVRHGPISWYDSQLIGGQRQKWLVQASPDWSKANLEKDPKVVQESLINELSLLLDMPVQPEYSDSHRWLYASSQNRSDSVAIWDVKNHLGYIGDWLCGGRVEGAMTSALHLFQKTR